QDYPLARMVEQSGARVSPTGSPFQVMFALHEFARSETLERLRLGGPGSEIEAGALRLSAVPFSQQEGQFDLSLEILPHAEEFVCVWHYDTDLLNKDVVDSWAGSLAELAGAVVENVHISLSNLPVVSHADRARLTKWNATERAYRTDVTLVDLLVEQAERTPDAIAVSAPDGMYTYAQLLRRAQAIALELRGLGVAEGDRVAVVLPRGRDLPAALLGVLGSGAAYVPLDPHHPVSRLEYALTDSGASAVVTAAGMPRFNLPMLDVGACGDATEAFCRTFPSATAYVIYTSGSTGRPKGVAVSHGALMNFLYSMAEEPGISPSDAVLAVTTVSFDIAALELFLPLIRGARVVIAHEDEVFDGARLARKLEAEGITVLQATPVTWKLLLEANWAGKAD